MSNQKDTLVFSGNVGGLSTETETTTLDADATVEEVRVRWWRGPELGLEIEPYVETERGPDSVDRQTLVELVGRDALVGDDDYITLKVSGVPVADDETIGVDVTNTWDPAAHDFAVDYDYRVEVDVDYAGGTERTALAALDGLASRVRGVLG